MYFIGILSENQHKVPLLLSGSEIIHSVQNNFQGKYENDCVQLVITYLPCVI